MVLDQRLTSELTSDLKAVVAEIEGHCARLGLDFFPVIFEMVDYQQMSEIAAYGGFPTRYPHWRFGMEYEQLSKSYEYGLSLIYEMVINNDPCYAYLLKSNSLVDQKTVIAHVYGHCDFFKNNYCFTHTNRKMLDEMANHGSRIRRYIEEVGHDEVENFIDVCLTLENLIDQHAPHIRREQKRSDYDEELLSVDKRAIPKLTAHKSYMEHFVNPKEYLKQQEQKMKEMAKQEERFPEHPQRDILQFLIQHASLNQWQRDILSIVREEAYYFAPQGQTKIMNEGWAVYWHSKIMTQFLLTDSEVVDYSDHYAGVLQTSPTRLNPYKLGLELMYHIERRWNKGKFGIDYMHCQDPAERKRWDKSTNEGLKKLFEVRKYHNDISFLDEFFDEDFCEESKMFTWIQDKRNQQVVIQDRDFKQIKKELLDGLTNFGQPIIEVVDGNYRNRGELLLAHRHQGSDLQVGLAIETLVNVYKIWKRPVHIETIVDGESKVFQFDGTEPHMEKRTA